MQFTHGDEQLLQVFVLVFAKVPKGQVDELTQLLLNR
jgi:hypothetical protein